MAGNQAALPAASNYVWTFTTGAAADTTAPTVAQTVPATTNPGPTPGALINQTVSAVFSEDMAIATITATSFKLACAAPCVSPTGSVSYVAGSKAAVFTPAAALIPATTYTATITTAATDLAGNPLASDYVWTFTTGVTTDTTRPTVAVTVPATTVPGPTPGVATNTAITATFSEDMIRQPLTGPASL
ncbi:MAG: Ig-like domain-containing protein [Gammaproteobacteria bacterium]